MTSPTRRGVRPKYSLEIKSKICCGCLIEKPIEDYQNDKLNSSGKKSRCRSCKKAEKLAYKTKYPDRYLHSAKVQNCMSNYKLTREEAEKIVSTRINTCSICGKLKKLVVDHCHKTEVIRGMVCSNCNSVLGYAKDNPQTLRNAAKYLEEIYGKSD